MDYLHSLNPGEVTVTVRVTTGREFVVSKAFLQKLLSMQDQFHKYAMVSFNLEGIDFVYTGDRARFRTSGGLFEFDKVTFSKMLKAWNLDKKTFLGSAANCQECE